VKSMGRNAAPVARIPLALARVLLGILRFVDDLAKVVSFLLLV
jgi:hypothetical protein